MHNSTQLIATANNMEWQKLSVPSSELCLSSVLRCGQSFRWKSSGGDEWSCALSGRILSLRQDSTHLYYRAVFPSPPLAKKKEGDNVDDTVDLIRDYFNLSINLTELYEKWSSRDPHFKKKAPNFSGIRMLRQDPWENLISFICSSNNNISRIGQMVENLCITFGTKLGKLGDTPYYDFPVPSTLTSSGVEEKLRALGFGYRAKYIHQTALMVVSARPMGWLDGLRKVPYKDAHEALLELQGVGPKVADCVCLMSLDKTESVPVDTHVWQIATRDYKFGKGKHKSLTKATYMAIGDHFRNLWGNEAGWAHSVLFTADLKSFAGKGTKVGGSATTTAATAVIVEEVKNKSDGVEDVASTRTVVTVREKRERKVKARTKIKGELEAKVEIGVKNKTNRSAGAIITTSVKKGTRKTKAEIKREVGDIGNQLTDTTTTKAVKKGMGGFKVGIKGENEDYLGADIKLESTESVVSKEERGLKRSFETKEEGLDLKLEGVGLTMADRIKRRRR